MPGDVEDLSQVLRARREKLAALRERGIEPFAYGFEASAVSTVAVSAFEEAEAAGSPSAGGHAQPARRRARERATRGVPGSRQQARATARTSTATATITWWLGPSAT